MRVSTRKRSPLVGIIMGSQSDYRIMKAAEESLSEFGISFEVQIVSAHRTPDFMYEYSRKAHSRGLRVLIAGAGGAAHLPGMVASLTPLPVIGVPIQATSLKGLDALLAIVQMPKGVPVACVAIDNAYNAGLLAVRMLMSCPAAPNLFEKMVLYMKKKERSIRRQSFRKIKDSKR